jgi:ribonuclease HI
MPTREALLAAIARLSPEEQVELAKQLLGRLKEEGRWPLPRRAGRPAADLVLHFDGGSLGNPGPGYGSFVITLPDGRPVRKRLDFRATLTSNEAEYRTLIAGLETIHGLFGEDVTRLFLEVRGDSQLVGHQLEGMWKATEPRMRALRDQALDLLGHLRSWRFVQVPRQESVRKLGH